MGILILGSTMVAIAFVAALGAAAFGFYHLHQEQAAHRRDVDNLVHQVTGRVPFDHRAPEQGEHAVHAFDDAAEAALEDRITHSVTEGVTRRLLEATRG